MTNNQRRFKAASKKAKGLYATGRYNTYGDAVKAAFKKIGGTTVKKKPKPKKKKVYQTGNSSSVRDRMIKAKPPGKRKTYTERRKNRSDMPGKMTGTAYNEMIIRNLHNDNILLNQAIIKLDQMKWQYKKLSRGPEKNTMKRLIKDQSKYIASKRKSLTMLKRLIK